MSVLAYVETKPALLLHDVLRRRVHHERLVARRALAVARVEVQHPAQGWVRFLDRNRRDSQLLIFNREISVNMDRTQDGNGRLTCRRPPHPDTVSIVVVAVGVVGRCIIVPPPKVCASGSRRPAHRTTNHQRQNGRRSKEQRSGKWKRREAARERNTGQQPKHTR